MLLEIEDTQGIITAQVIAEKALRTQELQAAAILITDDDLHQAAVV